jgi:hypothetical protein
MGETNGGAMLFQQKACNDAVKLLACSQALPPCDSCEASGHVGAALSMLALLFFSRSRWRDVAMLVELARAFD